MIGNWSNTPSVPFYANNGNGGFTYDAVIPGGTLTLNEDITLENLEFNSHPTTLGGVGNITANGLITLSHNLVLAGVGSITRQLNGTIVNGASPISNDLIKGGAGTWEITGNNTFTGRTWITGGTLVVGSVAAEGSPSALGAASDATARVAQANAPLPHLVLDSGTLRYTGSGHTTNRHFALGAGGGTIDASGTGALVISNWWVVANAGPDGARNLHLTGSSSDDNTLGLVITDYDFGYPGGDPGSANPFGAPTSVTKSGSGKWVIPATVANQPANEIFHSSYSGPTTILGGTLQVSRLANGGLPSAIGKSSASASNLVLDGGTLRYVYPGAPGTAAHDAGQVNRLFSIGVGGGTIDSSGGPLNLYNGGVIALPGVGERVLTLTGDFSDPIDGTNQYSAVNSVLGDNGGPTSLVKDGPGEWVLTNANVYGGSTTVNAGTLLVAHGDNRMPSTTSLTIGAAGRFEIFTGDSAFAYEPINQTVISLSGSGTIALNAGTLALINAAENTYSGAIIDSDTGGQFQTGGSFKKLGGATLTLSGLNRYTGVTAIFAGTLSVGALADAGSPSGIGAAGAAASKLLFDGSALRYTGAQASTNRNFSVGALGATLDASGSGPLAWNGSMVASATTGTQTLTLSGSNVDANTFSGTIANGSGSNVTNLAKTGTGRWIISGSNSFTGSTTVGAGTLVLANPQAISKTGRLATTGGNVVAAADLASAIKVSELNISHSTTVDLANNDMIVGSGTPKSIIEGYVRSAWNDFTWTGSGLTSSAASGPGGHATMLGVISGADLDSVGGSGVFSGEPYLATDTLVKYTWYGDTDLSGAVAFDDYVRTDTGRIEGRTGWVNGDFDFSGAVDFDDYVLIDLGFNEQNDTLGRAVLYLEGGDHSTHGMDDPALRMLVLHYEQFGDAYASHFLSAVPEPGAILLLGAAAPALICRKRRNTTIDGR